MYSYTTPESTGYEKMSISKKKLYGYFPNLKQYKFKKYEVYYTPAVIRIDVYNSFMCKAYLLLLFPLLVLTCGIFEAYEEVKRAIFQKKYGGFESIVISEKELTRKIIEENTD
jgi:hypothetical protein